MAKIERPLFGDLAGGSIAGLLTFRTRGGKAETMQQRKSTRDPSTEQELHRTRFATAHAEWMLLPKQRIYINKRYYWRRIPDWPTFYRAWPAPTAPSNLSATAISQTRIDLTWQDNSDNEDGFKIERKTGAGGTYTQISTTAANTTSYQNTGLTVGTLYYYRVRASNVVGDSEFSNEAQATTWIPTAPNAPSNLTATTISTTQINLTWTDNSNDESGFKIERKTGSGGTYAQIATVTANTISYQNTSLAAGTTYYYRARAYNDIGNSNYSNEASATTEQAQVPATPTNLSASAISSSQINLTWTDNATNESAYFVERKTGAGGSWSEITSLAQNTVSYNNTGLGAGTQFYYRVRCWNTNGYSGYSNEANATTQAGSCVKPVTLDYFEQGSWTSACNSTHNPGAYARYFSFTTTGNMTLYFECETNKAATMYLLQGHGMDGTIITQDSNSGGPGVPLIFYAIGTGNYTLEFCPQEQATTGNFNLWMSAW